MGIGLADTSDHPELREPAWLLLLALPPLFDPRGGEVLLCLSSLL